MDAPPLAPNDAERKRIVALVSGVSEDDLGRVAANGWTVAVLLAHLAFWDRWAEHLLHRWRQGQMPPPTVPGWYDDAINATLLPEWLAMAPASAADLALRAAEAVDRQIAHIETPVLAAIVAAGESDLVHRHRHRKEILDQIGQILGREV
jgi:hypothetical protein